MGPASKTPGWARRDIDAADKVLGKVEKREAEQIVERWWEWARPPWYSLRAVKWKKDKTEWSASTKQLRVAVAAETGHGDYGPYHRRFGHKEWYQCACGRDITVTHPYRCVMMRDFYRIRLGTGRNTRKVQYLVTYWNRLKKLRKALHQPGSHESVVVLGRGSPLVVPRADSPSGGP